VWRLLKLDLGGLILCAIYLVISLPLMLLAYTASTPKGTYVFLQLALFPAVILAGVLGRLCRYPESCWWWSLDFVIGNPWLNNTPVFFLISLAICYVIGWTCSLIARLLMRVLP
jgi:hypothetical protein